jgi:quinol monooxygenase YgiN
MSDGTAMMQQDWPTKSALLSPIVEVRQYDLVPGARDTLIDIFDSRLIEGQEVEGMVIIGQFRDLDNPDSFVWLRGFADMEARHKALEGFYSGPVWLANRDAANATMLRFDNVLLLRPATVDGGFAMDTAKRPAVGANRAGGLIVATIWKLRGEAAAFAGWHRENLLPISRDTGADIVSSFVTDDAENTYPALPVRRGETVFVTFSPFADAAAFDRHRAALAGSTRWAAATKAAGPYVAAAPQTLRLAPTARSLLR